jgi:hypothetical protein
VPSQSADEFVLEVEVRVFSSGLGPDCPSC